MGQMEVPILRPWDSLQNLTWVYRGAPAVRSWQGVKLLIKVACECELRDPAVAQTFLDLRTAVLSFTLAALTLVF